MKSADNTLKPKKARLVIIETTFDRLHPIVDMMSRYGYLPSAICDNVFRGVLFWQCDIVFVDKSLHDFLGAKNWNQSGECNSLSLNFKVGYWLPARAVFAKIKSKIAYKLSRLVGDFLKSS